MTEEKQKNYDYLKWLIIGLLSLAVLFFVFRVGVFVGQEKARFSYNWAENYDKNFGGPRMGFMRDWQNNPGQGFLQGHGIFGQIIKIEENKITIKDNTNLEKIILILQDTSIASQRKILSIKNLKIDDNIVVIGSPNEQGQIEAKLIRIIKKF